MSAQSPLPVVVVTGLHEAARRRAVLELLDSCPAALRGAPTAGTSRAAQPRPVRLANRPGVMLAWDAAGGRLAVQECGSWLACLPGEEWERYTPERRVAAAAEWDARYGDRVQLLAFTARDLDADGTGIRSQLELAIRMRTVLFGGG